MPKIAVKDLQVNTMVVGTAVTALNHAGGVCKTIVGRIVSITTTQEGIMCYTVLGENYKLKYVDTKNPPIHSFSGILKETEIEVIDPVLCQLIASLFKENLEMANLGKFKEVRGNMDKISDIRHKSRFELETKYGVPGGT
jgi:hypothetical protein